MAGSNERSINTEFNPAVFKVPDFISAVNGWEDASWRNDLMPSFRNKERKIVLWIDTVAVETRAIECEVAGELYQYHISNCDDDGVSLDTVYYTNEEKELEQWLNKQDKD